MLTSRESRMQARWQRALVVLGALLAVAILAACSSVSEVSIQVPPRTGVGTTSAAPQAYPERVAAAYSQLFSDSSAPPLADLPGPINVLNLAFAAGNPLTLVGRTPQGNDAMVDDIRLLRSQGVRVILSIGGASDEVDTSDRAAFVDRVMAINNQTPLDGIDWDIEASSINVDDIVAISSELVERRGENFAVTLAPNGGNINDYLPVAQALEQRGLLTMISQQFYDAQVSTSRAVDQVGLIRSAGIDEDHIGIGMMVGDESRYWTIDECIDAVRAVRESYPLVRGGFLWETSRDGTDEWSVMVAPLLTGSSAPDG